MCCTSQLPLSASAPLSERIQAISSQDEHFGIMHDPTILKLITTQLPDSWKLYQGVVGAGGNYKHVCVKMYADRT